KRGPELDGFAAPKFCVAERHTLRTRCSKLAQQCARRTPARRGSAALRHECVERLGRIVRNAKWDDAEARGDGVLIEEEAPEHVRRVRLERECVGARRRAVRRDVMRARAHAVERMALEAALLTPERAREIARDTAERRQRVALDAPEALRRE